MSWPTALLGDVALKVDYGVTASAASEPVGPSFLRITDIQDNAVDWRQVPWCKCGDRERIDARLQPGDIVFARTGATTGKSFLIKACPADAVFASYLIRVRPSPKVDAQFLAHFFQTPLYWSQINKSMRGAGQPGVNATSLKMLLVQLPPLEEQRRIAAILDKAEELRTKRRAALALLDSLPQAIFLEMFGDPLTNLRNWPTRQIGDICNLVRGSSPRPQGNPRFFGGPIPRLMIADITRDGLLTTPHIDSLTIEGALKSRPVKAGTIAMAVSGNIGLVTQLAVDACVHDGFVAFKDLDEHVITPLFLLHLLNSAKSMHGQNMAGAIFINIKTDDIKALRIPIPSICIQQQFARRIILHSSLRTSAEAVNEKTAVLIASLQTSLFANDYLASLAPHRQWQNQN